jgi:DNA-binding response OmpR family regulator
MAKDILIVDSDEAFAVMLHDSIRREINHRVSICTSMDEAIRNLRDTRYDLAIVDLGVEEHNPLSLLRAMRRQQGDLRLIVIPLMGEDLPEEIEEANIQGVLTKPFFIGDLAGTIEAALATPMESVSKELAHTQPADAAPEEQPVKKVAPANLRPSASRSTWAVDAQTLRVLSDLHREVAAEAVILTGPAGIAAQSGEIRGLDAGKAGEMLARLSDTMADALVVFNRVNRGDQDVLHQGYCEGLGRRLYWASLNRDWLIVCVLDIDTPLGMLRYHLRRAASQLAAFAG